MIEAIFETLFECIFEALTDFLGMSIFGRVILIVFIIAILVAAVTYPVPIAITGVALLCVSVIVFFLAGKELREKIKAISLSTFLLGIVICIFYITEKIAQGD